MFIHVPHVSYSPNPQHAPNAQHEKIHLISGLCGVLLAFERVFNLAKTIRTKYLQFKKHGREKKRSILDNLSDDDLLFDSDNYEPEMDIVIRWTIVMK